MNDNLQYTIVDGIKCFSPEVANSYADYPDGGFALTDKSGESSFWVRSRNRLLKSIVYDQMASTRKSKFLEIGCGTGGFIQQIVENENLEITGSEIYIKGLLYAKKNIPSVDFIQYDVTKGKIGEEFDIIVAFDVLEHIDNDFVAISNMFRMLNKRGCLIITVPQYMFLWSKLDEIVKHKRRYSKRELVAKLQETGFDISYSSSFVFILFPLMLIYRMFDKGRGQSEPEEVAFKKRVSFPLALNRIFDFFMRIDEALIRFGVSLPFGGTLLVIAHRH